VAFQNDVYPKMISLPDGFKDIDEWANTSPTKDQIDKVFTDATDGFL
jgi:hypothetical protein